MDVKTIVLAVLLILQSLGLGVTLNRTDEVQTKVNEVHSGVDEVQEQVHSDFEKHHKP